MRLLLWYCDVFAWNPSIKTIEQAGQAKAETYEKVVVAFIHVEPQDVKPGSSAETKLVKNVKWLARKWNTKRIVLHSFSHLGEEKAEPDLAKKLFDNALKRLNNAGYEAVMSPYGYFNDLEIKAPGDPLARIYKSF
ncbi:hypothetical protein JCM13304A_04680 [Desulfothermus okinawensis JCM 13304]